MNLFTPPIGPGVAWAEPDRFDPANLLMRFYGNVPTGVTVWRTPDGRWHESQYPLQEHLDQATHVYLGGHTYEVSDEEAALLVAAGYGDNIHAP